VRRACGPWSWRRPRPGRGPAHGSSRWWRCSPGPPPGGPGQRSGSGPSGRERRSNGRSWTAPTGAAVRLRALVLLPGHPQVHVHPPRGEHVDPALGQPRQPYP
jgi:hypothetical protein